MLLGLRRDPVAAFEVGPLVDMYMRWRYEIADRGTPGILGPGVAVFFDTICELQGLPETL